MLSFVQHFEKESDVRVMKKVISISLTFLMLIALLHFSIATHYCGGMVAASKISLSGKLATCGMEVAEKDSPKTGSHFNKHCCDNGLVFCGIISNYFPSFSSVPESYQTYLQVFSAPVDISIISSGYLKSIHTNISPPGIFISNSVDLSGICILRI